MSRMKAGQGSRRSLDDSLFLRENSSSFLDAGSFRIHYIHAGSGDPLILIHGGGIWSYSFRHNIGPLSRRFSVYAPDMPGYGFSSARRHDPLDNRTMVLFMKALMDGLGISRASLAGHSWGGGWVLNFAGTFPDMVDRIVLIDSSGLDVPDELEWEFLKLPFIGSILFRLMSPAMVRIGLQKVFYRKELVDDEMVQEAILNFGTRRNRKAQARNARNISWKQTQAGLENIPHPVLLIWGQEDRYLPVDLAGRFRERIKNIRTEIIPRCGHAPHEECPETVNRLIIDFLKR